MPTAILIDGDFFLKRHRFIYGTMKPAEIAIMKAAFSHCLFSFF